MVNSTDTREAKKLPYGGRPICWGRDYEFLPANVISHYEFETYLDRSIVPMRMCEIYGTIRHTVLRLSTLPDLMTYDAFGAIAASLTADLPDVIFLPSEL